MTRINSAIPVKKLTDEHLLAERREIKRLQSCYLKAKIILSVFVLSAILLLACFIPIKKYPTKYDTYEFDVELVNGKSRKLFLKLSSEYEYYVYSRKGSYILIIEDMEVHENIYGIKVRHTDNKMRFPGVCFVNSVTKE